MSCFRYFILQRVFYEIGLANWPATLNSRIVQNGSIFLPVVNVNANITAFSANERFRSFAIAWWYVISTPTPGFYWDNVRKVLKVSIANHINFN